MRGQAKFHPLLACSSAERLPVEHFSVYAALIDTREAGAAGSQILAAYAFPNPARKGQSPKLRAELNAEAERVEARIYTLAGEKVAELELVQATMGNGRFLYDAVWETGKTPSGVYLYYIRARHRHGAETSRNGRLALIR